MRIIRDYPLPIRILFYTTGAVLALAMGFSLALNLGALGLI